MDDFRNRYLQDRVLTASPTQRVVMLYDRLLLDLARARAAQDATNAGPHLAHAALIVAELHDSLDHSVGGPVANLVDLYSYLLRELLTAQAGNECAADSLATIEQISTQLRDTWATVAQTQSAGLAGSSWTA